MNSITKELRFYVRKHKDKKRTTCWVVHNTYGKYLAWDFYQVWRWTKHLPDAARFRTEEDAHLAVTGTTMPLRHRYQTLQTPR